MKLLAPAVLVLLLASCGPSAAPPGADAAAMAAAERKAVSDTDAAQRDAASEAARRDATTGAEQKSGRAG